MRQYKKYKLAAGKTAKSINISCGARLAPFDIQELREITMYDELELDTLGDKIYDNPNNADDKNYRKTALFLIMSDTDTTFNFLISMIYSQLFNLLCEKADDQYGGRLPVHVRCLIDEAANIGQIPNLEKLMATIRSREISACLVLQAQSQLKALYKDSADTIIGNCDSSIFLGGKEPTTLKELNQALGKETIGPLIGLWFQSLFVGLTIWGLTICILIVVYGRMIEIYLVTSVAPIPMATMVNREWGQMGQNYLRSLLALGFQAFLIIICVAIYAVLIRNIGTIEDISKAIWTCLGYTVLLCFTLFKTGSLAKSVFNAH